MAHPLDGCRAKIQRAEESLKNLDQEVNVFYNRAPLPYQIVTQHQNCGLEYVFVAFGEPEAPVRFSVIAGEIVHHLRSSLDHLIHALIVQNGNTPTRKNQFPICTSKELFEKECKNGRINGVSLVSKNLILAVQPYTSVTPVDTVLHVVQEYDNIDKHRLLVVVTSVVELGKNIHIGTDEMIPDAIVKKGQGPVIVGLGDPLPKKLSKEGVEVFKILLAKPAPEFVASAEFVAQIAFEDCGRAKLAPVIRTLAAMIAGTKHTIETFSCEF